MGKFRVELEDGRKFDVELEEGATQADAEAAVMDQLGFGASQQPEDNRGMLEATGDWFTGSRREEGIPAYGEAGFQLPDFPDQKTGVGGQLQGLGFGAGMATSYKDEDTAAVIKNYYPQANFSRDQYGNMVAEIDGQRFYPDPSGLDQATWQKLVTGAIGGGLASGLIRKMLGVEAASGFGGAMVTGATEMGGTELVSSMAGDRDYDPLMPVFGAGGGGAGQVVGKYILPPTIRFARDAVDYLANAVRNKAPDVLNTSGGQGVLSAQVEKELIDAGLDPATITREVLLQLQKDINLGLPVEQAATRAQQQAVNIPLTRGEQTGSIGQQVFESEAGKSSYGETAAGTMQRFREQQQQAIRSEGERIGEQLGGGAGGISQRSEGAEQVQQALLAFRKEEKERASDLYNQARNTGRGAFMKPEEGAAIIQRFGADGELGTSLRALEISDGGKGIANFWNKEIIPALEVGGNINTLFEARKVLTKSLKTHPEAGTLRNALDRELTDQMEQGLLYGDPASVAAWMKANANYRAYKQKWDSSNILGKLTDRNKQTGQLIKQPEDVANAIFGTALSGQHKAGLNKAMLDLKNATSKNPEEFNRIRQEFWLMLTDNMHKGKLDELSGGNMFKAWKNFQRNNPTVVKTMFNEEERGLINAYTALAAKATTGAQNYSNTASALSGILQRLMASMGATSAFRALSQQFVFNALRKGYGVAKTEQAVQQGLKPKYPSPVTTQMGTITGAGAAAQPDSQEQLMRLMP